MDPFFFFNCTEWFKDIQDLLVESRLSKPFREKAT